MAVTRFKLNLEGFREIRKSAEVTAEVRKLAEEVARRAGSGYEATESPSRNRARFTVHPETIAATVDNAKNNTLVKALKS